jgi:alkanesulfonate monooxygenase SsuD/methylene tetrahydromethanopterin reductase-like flavin-dependent oxidoreductase (luciferase family)
MHDALCEPRPVQAHLPLLIGGSGPTKTLPLIARYADLWNTRGTPEQLAAHDARLRAWCDAIGRDPESIERTVFQNVVIRPTRSAALEAWEGYRAVHQPQTGEDRPEVVGSIDEVAASLRATARVGFRHAIWVFRSPFDIATMDALPDIRAATEGA